MSDGNMRIPTEPIGSVPRPSYLIDAVARYRSGSISQSEFDAICDRALAETIAELEATGSPIITDGEQTKSSFVSYPLDGLENLAPDGVSIPFADGHMRQLPRLTREPFRYSSYAGDYVRRAKRFTKLPLKQAVIAPSALSLLYPGSGIKGYPREAFLEDLLVESEKDITSCFEAGAETVQLDFTEGRLAVKLDPSRRLLEDFVDLINGVLGRFPPEQRKRISVHTCPGSDQDSTHSADVDYADLLPLLFKIRAGAFMCALAGENNKPRVLQLMRDHVQADQKVFVGVIDPIDPKIETPDEVAARVIEAAEYIPLSQLGVTDDCGFSPFGDDQSTARELRLRRSGRASMDLHWRKAGWALRADSEGMAFCYRSNDFEASELILIIGVGQFNRVNAGGYGPAWNGQNAKQHDRKRDAQAASPRYGEVSGREPEPGTSYGWCG